MAPTNMSACRSKCGPCDPFLTVVSDRPPRLARPRFFLHEHGGFNFSDVLQEVRTVLAGRPADVALPVGYGQYLLDIPLLEALSKHPQRTFDLERATVHVLAVAPFASWVMARRRGVPEAHEARMQEVANELRRSPFFRGDSPIVLLLGGETLMVLGVPLQKVLTTGQVLLGCTDPTNADIGPYPLSNNVTP